MFLSFSFCYLVDIVDISLHFFIPASDCSSLSQAKLNTFKALDKC